MNDEIQVIDSCGNVFLDLGFSSEEATLLKMRADLGRVCKPPPEMPENPLLAAQRGVMNLSDYEFGSFAHL
jgi:hypothetical protein